MTIARQERLFDDAVRAHARWRGRSTAIVEKDRAVTWGNLNEAINRAANGLHALGIGRGDKVATLLPNSIDTVVVMLGIIRAGAVLVPFSTMLTADSLRLLLEDSDSAVLFAGAKSLPLVDDLRPRLRKVRQFISVGGTATGGWVDFAQWSAAQSSAAPVVALTPDDDFNIIYSSGTTGVPKGIVHTHYARWTFCMTLGVEFGVTASSVVLVSTPLSSNGTWIFVLPALLFGGTLVILEAFAPSEFLRAAEKHRCSHAFVVPTQLAAIVNDPAYDPARLSAMRALLSAGGTFPVPLKKRLHTDFPQALCELYGLTEGVGTILRPDEVPDRLASVGRPFTGVELFVVDDAGNEVPSGTPGEIVASGPSLLRQYYKNEEGTRDLVFRTVGGMTFIRTGDIGKLDEDGFLYIVDRKKDMIVSGGLNVYPSDIESVLLTHPAVAECTVIPVPSEKWGETPLALIVPKGGNPSSPAEILEWLNTRLAAHQRVSSIEVRESLPRNALGKVMKQQLKASYWTKQQGRR